MASQTPRTEGTVALWLSLGACILFDLAAVYAALTAKTSGDLAMASLAIPLFGWCAAVMAGTLRNRHRGPSP